MSKKNENEIVRIVDVIKRSTEAMTARMKKLGMTKKAIEKFFNNEEVIICYYCHTPNMFEVNYNEKSNWSMYECLSCGKTYLKDWDKKD